MTVTSGFNWLLVCGLILMLGACALKTTLRLADPDVAATEKQEAEPVADEGDAADDPAEHQAAADGCFAEVGDTIMAALTAVGTVSGSLARLSADEEHPFRRGGRDRFAAFDHNPVKVVAEDPVSTFSVDVDTASYAFVRASLNRGALPAPDAVRIEELVNYFPYGYEPPASRERPFAVHAALMPAPWNAAALLLRVGVQGYRLERAAAPPANLVFLIDSSGSMDAPDKLPLLISSFKLLLDTLTPDDTVAIVTYAGAAGTVLEPTRAGERGRILATLDSLRAGGSTAGGEGLRQAYLLAERRFVAGGVNRVILATDGDFNVGIADVDELEGCVARKRESGVSCRCWASGWAITTTN